MPGAAQRFGVIVGRTCLARRLFRPAIGPPPGKQCARTGQRLVAGTQAHRSSLVRIHQSEKRLTLSARVCTVENPTNA
jgi:hypothetical protein